MKSLASSLSPEMMVRQLILKLANPSYRQKVVVWTEGKDWRVYRKFFDPDKIISHGMGSCEQIDKGHHLLKNSIPSIKSIVVKDADFKRLEGDDMDADSNVFYTDGHDVEMMMIKQEKVRNGVCDGFEYDGDKNQFFDDVFFDLYYLSYFKWFDCHHKRCYSYRPMGKVRQEQTDLHDLTWIEKKLYQCSKSCWDDSNHSTPFIRINPNDVNEFIRNHQPIDRYELTNGHDFCNRLCMHIEQKTRYVRNEEEINDTLIAHFDDEQFKDTNLYRSLKAWCDANVNIMRM